MKFWMEKYYIQWTTVQSNFGYNLYTKTYIYHFQCTVQVIVRRVLEKYNKISLNKDPVLKAEMSIKVFCQAQYMKCAQHT